MTTLRTITRALLAFAVLLSADAFARADESESGNVAPSANRWALFIDAANDSTDKKYEALVRFRDALIASGIPEENAPIYSASSDDPVKRPTRKTLDMIVNALQRPGDVDLLPGETQGRKIRSDEGVCEVQIYLTAPGVANEETGEAFFAPADVDESQISDWNDPKLIPLKTLEDALLTPIDGKPLERTLFVVALNVPRANTRGTSAANNLKGVDLKRLPVRGSGSGNAFDASKFAHFRITTKNARYDDRLVGSFYSTLRDGLAGSADVAGNQNGTVTADELASYLETLARMAGNTVVVAQYGNASYPLCRTQKRPSIPIGIFDELAETFDSPLFRKERESAVRRAKDQRAREKNNDEVTTKGNHAG